MAFIGNLSKNSLYMLRATSIGTLGAIAYIYLKRKKQNSTFKSQQATNSFNQPFTENKNAYFSNTFSEGSSFGADAPLASLPMENRIDFVKKVYGLVCSQLAAVGISTALAFRYIRTTGRFLVPGAIIGGIGAIASIIAMHSNKVRTNDNIKKICLGVFTVSEMMLLPLALVQIPREIIMSALVNTGLIVGGLTGYAHVTKRDYSPYTGLLTGLIFGLLGTSVLLLFFPKRIPQQFVAWAGAGIFSFALVHDTQKLLGRGQCKYNYGDYDIATIAIYLGVINLFFHMLSIMMNSQRRRK